MILDPNLNQCSDRRPDNLDPGADGHISTSNLLLVSTRYSEIKALFRNLVQSNHA